MNDEYKELMERLGSYGFFSFIKFDPLRDKKRFTVLVSRGFVPDMDESFDEYQRKSKPYRVDTDSPLGALRWLTRSITKEEDDVAEDNG